MRSFRFNRSGHLSSYQRSQENSPGVNMSYNEEGEEWSHFIGPCTCDHDTSEHTWGGCEMCLCPEIEINGKLERPHHRYIGECKNPCPCQAGWEE